MTERTALKVTPGRGCFSSWRFLLLWLAFVVPPSAACSRPSAGVVSLIEQIPEDAAAGPWTCLAFLGGGKEIGERARGLAHDDDVAVQTGTTSSIQLSTDVQPDKVVILGVAYGSNLGPEVVVKARFFAGDVLVSTVTFNARERYAELVTRSPPSGADRIVVHHRIEEGTALTIRSLGMVSLVEESTHDMLRRARATLRFALSQQPHNGRRCLVQRRFPFEMDRCRRHGAILTSHEALLFKLPEDWPQSHLVFWTLGPLHSPDAGLSVELGDGTSWDRVAKWTSAEITPGHWVKLEFDGAVKPRARSVRYVLSGRDDAVLIAEPVILQNPGRRATKHNLIIVDLDTVRADRMGCYGYSERPTSAALDSIMTARGFYVFRTAYSAASWTLPATAKFLTSRYREIAEPHELPRRYTTLAEFLRDAGYYCVAFTGGAVMRSPGLEQGFHEYWFSENIGKVEDTFPQSMQWLRTSNVHPFFLFLHTYEAHVPYTRDVFCRGLPNGDMGNISAGEPLFATADTWSSLPPAESLYVQAAYDGGVRYACDATAELLVLADRLALWDNTIVVVLSDHGEEFWDHFTVFANHGYSVYGEQINVPFTLYSPGVAQGSMNYVEQPVSTVDLVPTVLDLLDIESSHEFDGVSLVPSLCRSPVERRVPILAISKRTTLVRMCTFSHGMKYIETSVDSSRATERSYLRRLLSPQKELFDLGEDPDEYVNLVDRRPEMMTEMASRLRRGLRSAIEPELRAETDAHKGDLPEQLKKQLAALGYVDLE